MQYICSNRATLYLLHIFVGREAVLFFLRNMLGQGTGLKLGGGLGGGTGLGLNLGGGLGQQTGKAGGSEGCCVF